MLDCLTQGTPAPPRYKVELSDTPFPSSKAGGDVAFPNRNTQWMLLATCPSWRVTKQRTYQGCPENSGSVIANQKTTKARSSDDSLIGDHLSMQASLRTPSNSECLEYFDRRAVRQNVAPRSTAKSPCGTSGELHLALEPISRRPRWSR